MTINSIRLSIQRALLGFITPNLRAVYVKYSDDLIELIFYFDKPPTEKEQELSDLVDTEFISDFPAPQYRTNFQIIILPYPTSIPKDGICVYKRYE